MNSLQSAVVVLPVVLTSVCMGYEVPVVQQGQARAVIVLPERASEALNNGAAEIVTYVKKISGAQLQIGPPKKTLTAIRLEVDPQAIPREDAFRIVTGRTEIRLIGGAEMGTLFACYAFLEDLGVRWLVPGEDG